MKKSKNNAKTIPKMDEHFSTLGLSIILASMPERLLRKIIKTTVKHLRQCLVVTRDLLDFPIKMAYTSGKEKSSKYSYGQGFGKVIQKY